MVCEDINKAQSKIRYDFVFVDKEDFRRYNPKTFTQLIQNFRKYKYD
jgi:type III restriction enzyme